MKQSQLKIKKVSAQSGNVTFELHSLGWEAFQNLCGHVMQEILGQTVTVFSPTNDVGQDGAFQGTWRRSAKEIYSGRFIIQCKFTSGLNEHLSLSDLKDELAKAQKLARANQAKTYLLITNAKLTGEADSKIRAAFLALEGIEHFDILGSEWLTKQILTSKRLRAFVPRLYGLGDLTQILDERIYRQAEEILHTWKENLRKFVPTKAHLDSVKALLKERFVMLLGEPMAGKSTIAAALALAAAGQGCSTVFVTDPQQFKAHWNPDEPNQFFWVDDVFGQTQYNSALAHGWSRLFPDLAAAVRKGARVLFTSRTYIYRQALQEIKKTAFPLIEKQQVVIEVEKLSLLEKQRILYNHIRLGNQPPIFRSQIKPHLEAVAESIKFFPEIAKRLGDPFFTNTLTLERTSIMDFVERPSSVLQDIISELDQHNFAALALLYMRSGQASVPLDLDMDEHQAMKLLGAGIADVHAAILSLEGSLTSTSKQAGQAFWKFRHPSVRDAMAALISTRPEFVDIYLGGAKITELLKEVVCGDIVFEGASVHIPPNRFDRLVQKLKPLNLNDFTQRRLLISFLRHRCPSDFVLKWFSTSPEQFDHLFQSVTYDREVRYIFALIHQNGILPENYRQAYYECVSNEAIDNADTKFLWPDFQTLLNREEEDAIIVRAQREWMGSSIQQIVG